MLTVPAISFPVTVPLNVHVNGISGNLHGAVQLDLISVNRAFEGGVVDLSGLRPRDVVASSAGE